MNKKYPFDPFLKHHLIIALSFAIWVFVFLYFTEPLDIRVFNSKEKLIYLPLYSFSGAIIYLSVLPIQFKIFNKNNKKWSLKNELFIFGFLLLIGLIIIRLLFVYVVMFNEKVLGLFSFIGLFFIPAVLTLFPIIILSRWSFGRYFEKKIEDKKIEIKGEGNFENLRILFSDLVYIKSSDNYVEITYQENNNFKKVLIRTKISSIIKTFPTLLQTHRSFLVNPFHFKQWKNQKGKTEIVLKNDVIVPISKTFLKNVKETLNLTTK